MAEVQRIDCEKEYSRHLELAQHFNVMGMKKRSVIHFRAAHSALINEKLYVNYCEKNKLYGHAKTTS